MVPTNVWLTLRHRTMQYSKDLKHVKITRQLILEVHHKTHKRIPMDTLSSIFTILINSLILIFLIYTEITARQS